MTDSFSTQDLLFMIANRLHVKPRSEMSFHDWTAYLNFQHISAHKNKADKVHIFVVSNDAPVLLEDEWPLFPSDTLITQLRLLEGK